MGCRDIDGLSAIRIENRIRNPHDFFFAISAIRMQKLAHIRYPQNPCAPLLHSIDCFQADSLILLSCSVVKPHSRVALSTKDDFFHLSIFSFQLLS